jgi:hypothetical protein
MKRLFATALLIFFSLAAFALPSVDAVQAEVNRGNYVQAEAMMREVVAAKPNSAKAHYLYAEILAHNKSFDLAAQEARLARQNDPAIKFTSPEKFRNFEELIQREQRIAATPAVNPAVSPRQSAQPVVVRQQPAPAADRGMPGWVWGLGFAAVAFVIWRVVTARQRQQAAMMPMAAGGATYGGAAYGGGPGYVGGGMQPGYGPMAPGGGSGMLGTGLAVAGGFAAGMVAEKLIHGSGSSAAEPGVAGGLAGGFDTPMRNDAAEALEQRPIDFGSGGDWGGDAGGSDAGGGGDGGGGDW